MNKVVRDGMVAVLYSPGYGAGWYSWNDYEELLFNPTLVEMVEQGKQSEITEEFVKNLLGIDIYVGGADQLEIEWITEGSAFKIDEYDGSESVCTMGDINFIVA